MSPQHRKLIIIVALLAIIGIGIQVRSYYIKNEGKYLLAFDPYYHYRMGETILEEGTRPEWDTMAAYPTGAPVWHPPLFHYYLAYSYSVINIFSDISLFQWSLYANILPLIGAIIFAYLAGKVLTNEIGGLFTALFAAVNGAIASRTVIGYTDTDIWIVLFSFAAAYFLFSILKTDFQNEDKKKYIWPFLLGFTLFLFSMTWNGHWHLFLLVFASLILYLIIEAVKRKFDYTLLYMIALTFGSFALPWTVYQESYEIGAILAILGVIWVIMEKFSTTRIKKLGIPAVCAAIIGATSKVMYDENVFATVIGTAKRYTGSSPESAAINRPDISISIVQRYEVTFSTLSALFGLLLVVAIFGFVFLVWKRTRFSLQASIYLILYLLGTSLLVLMGGRYTMLLAIPLILAGGAFFGILPDMLKGRVTSTGAAAVIFVCALSVVPCYITGLQVSKASPAMNDDLWEALTWIDQNTPQDAVVISGWDAGYWVESIARRKSVMNGAHYDIWWRMIKYGKLLETSDESIALKEIYGFDDPSEVRTLREFPEDDKELVENEMGALAEEDAYVLVSEWTMLTFYWISYFGNWNYVTGEGEGRVYNPLWAQTARKLISATDYVYGDQNTSFSVIKEGENLHSYILDESGYVPTMGTLFHKNDTMYFLNRAGGEFGIIYVPPESIAFFETEKVWADMPSEVFLIKREDLLCMFTSLYFFNGEGLVYFELVKDCGTAKVYKVHKTPQELDQGIASEEDTYEPV